MTTKSIKKNTIAVGINNILVNIAMVITSILVARDLGPEKQGFIALLFLVVDFVSRFMSFGIQSAAQYFINSAKDETEKVINSVFTIFFVLSLIIGLGVIAFYRPEVHIDIFGIKGALIAAIFVGLYIIANFTRVNLVGLCYALEEFSKANFFNLLNVALPALFFVIAFLCHKLTVEVALISYLFTSVLGTFWVVRSFRRMNYKIGLYYDKDLFLRMLKYGLPIFYNSVAMYLQQRLNALFVGRFLGLIPLGYFSVAYGVSDRLTDVSTPLVTTHLPRVTKIKNDSTEEAVQFTIDLFKVLFAVYLLLLVPYGIAIYFLLPIFYSNLYTPSIAPAIVMTIATVAWGLSRLLFNLYASLHRQKMTSVVLTAGIILNAIGLGLVVLKHGNIMWVAIFNSLSTFSVLIIMSLLTCRDFKLTYKDFYPNFKGLKTIFNATR